MDTTYTGQASEIITKDFVKKLFLKGLDLLIRDSFGKFEEIDIFRDLDNISKLLIKRRYFSEAIPYLERQFEIVKSRTLREPYNENLNKDKIRDIISNIREYIEGKEIRLRNLPAYHNVPTKSELLSLETLIQEYAK